MAEYVHLVGAEQVSDAARNIGGAADNMRGAADNMRRAANEISESLFRHERFLESWLSQLRDVLTTSRGGRDDKR